MLCCKASLAIALLTLVLASFSDGALVNITIDDNSTGTSTTFYSGSWIRSSSCSSIAFDPLSWVACSQNIDLSQAKDNTWTGIVTPNWTASHPSFPGFSWPSGASIPQISAAVNLTFNGTAIYVYHIIPADATSIPSEFNITFTLDDGVKHLKTYSKTTETQYNELAFSMENLNNTLHILSVQVGSGDNVQMYFDYAVYTSPKEDSSSTTPSTGPSSTLIQPTTPASSSSASRSDIAAILGGVLGSTGGLVICIAILVFLLKRRRPDVENARAQAHPWQRDDTEEGGRSMTASDGISKGTDAQMKERILPQLLQGDVGISGNLPNPIPDMKSCTLGVHNPDHGRGASQRLHSIRRSLRESIAGLQERRSNSTRTGQGQVPTSGPPQDSSPINQTTGPAEADSEGTSRRIAVLEMEIERLQTRFNQAAFDVLPEYHESNGRRQSTVTDARQQYI